MEKIFFLFAITQINYYNILLFSKKDNIVDDLNNGYSSITSTKDNITDKILNGSKSIFDKVLSPSKEKSFPKVCLKIFLQLNP